MGEWDYIAENLERVRERISAACQRGRRDPSAITLVAVSKTMPAEAVVTAYRCGVRHFGENRAEEALPKIERVAVQLAGEPAPIWHMIGHLQRRKVRDAMPAFAMVHSLDRLAVAEEMEKRLKPLGKVMPILIEVNVSGEESKWGFAPADVPAAVEAMLSMPHVEIRGLMTMAPIVPEPELARPYFRALRELRDALAGQFCGVDWRELSMGMTDDFEPAIEEGATMVRIGRAIFSPR